MKSAKNIIIKLLCIVVALIIGYLLSEWLFEALFWRCLFCGVFICLAYMVMGWIIQTIKATKDPDVQAASGLRMSITRYRLYQRIWNEYQDYMQVHGIDTPESEQKFRELFKQIPNPNEWRRFGKYMEEKEKNARMEELYKELGYDD